MRRIWTIGAFLVGLSLAHTSVAYEGYSKSDSFIFDINAFYFSDTASINSTSSSSTRTFYDLHLGVKVTKGGGIYMGWNYGTYATASASGATTESYSSTQMGPKLSWFFDKDHNWCFGIAYNLVSSASYSTGGSTSQQWRGTAIKADFGYASWVTSSFSIGGKINYNSASFSESSTDGSTYTKATNSRVHIFPSIYMGLNF